MNHINKMVNSQIKTKRKKKKFMLENSTKTKSNTDKKYCHGTKKYRELHKHM